MDFGQQRGGFLVVSTVALQQGGPGFQSRPSHLSASRSWVRYPAGVGPLCVEFACLANMQVRLTGVGVTIGLNGCLSVNNWQLVQGVPHLWDWLQCPRDPAKYKWLQILTNQSN